MGTSGSGKSTLLNIIGCLDRPTEGSYYLDSKDVSKLDKIHLASIRNKKIGFVFQGFNENILRERHRLSCNDADDFQISNLTDMLATAESVTSVMTMLLASVAAVSLMVGGIGREIGLRMAVGATENNIRNQFLVEALVLCLIGGIAGIILGIV